MSTVLSELSVGKLLRASERTVPKSELLRVGKLPVCAVVRRRVWDETSAEARSSAPAVSAGAVSGDAASLGGA